MKTGFYPKLAITGISKNRKTYIPYILTCLGMVMMFYIISALSLNSEISHMRGGAELQFILSFGVWVIAFFSFIFLFYTHSFLMKRRKTEFGIYNILGMGKGNIARILLWENLFIAVFSIILGILCGVLFSKVAQLVMARFLGGEVSFAFTFEVKSAITSCIVFAVIFAVIVIDSMRQIHSSKPIELLHSTNVGEKAPKANWFMAFVGVAVLGFAYYIAATIQNPIAALFWFFIAVLMVIAATYILFICGSVVLCRILQKNKKYYYKSNHFVSVSSMSYRMKRNGAGLASICILCTMVLVMITSTASLYFGKEDSLRKIHPRDFTIQTYDADGTKTDAIVDRLLTDNEYTAENVLKYRSLECGAYFTDSSVLFDRKKVDAVDISHVFEFVFLPLDDYNILTGTNATLADNEVFVYSQDGKYNFDTISIDKFRTFNVKDGFKEIDGLSNHSMTVVSAVIVVLPDVETLFELNDYQQVVYEEASSEVQSLYYFDLSCEDDEQLAFVDQLRNAIRDKELEGEDFPTVFTSAAAEDKNDFYASYSGLFVLGILLGIVFIVAAILIMYYKQITEGYEDQSRFDILQKVGMTKAEIKKSVNSQILTVFFLPLIAAGLHITFAFNMISKLLSLFSLTNISLQIIVTVCFYLLFALLYALVYIITSKAYYGIVSSKN